MVAEEQYQEVLTIAYRGLNLASEYLAYECDPNECDVIVASPHVPTHVAHCKYSALRDEVAMMRIRLNTLSIS